MTGIDIWREGTKTLRFFFLPSSLSTKTMIWTYYLHGDRQTETWTNPRQNQRYILKSCKKGVMKEKPWIEMMSARKAQREISVFSCILSCVSFSCPYLNGLPLTPNYGGKKDRLLGQGNLTLFVPEGGLVTIKWAFWIASMGREVLAPKWSKGKRW